ncbi:hypothetical protein [Methanosarcina barkeri]|nr:hypothetical protein [Methanosarcina barkeri]
MEVEAFNEKHCKVIEKMPEDSRIQDENSGVPLESQLLGLKEAY